MQVYGPKTAQYYPGVHAFLDNSRAGRQLADKVKHHLSMVAEYYEERFHDAATDLKECQEREAMFKDLKQQIDNTPNLSDRERQCRMTRAKEAYSPFQIRMQNIMNLQRRVIELRRIIDLEPGDVSFKSDSTVRAHMQEVQNNLDEFNTAQAALSESKADDSNEYKVIKQNCARAKANYTASVEAYGFHQLPPIARHMPSVFCNIPENVHGDAAHC